MSNKIYSKKTSVMGIGIDGKVLEGNFQEVVHIADHVGPSALF